jgi:hypothetical protein
MTINQAIARLIELREKHGNIDVVTDCAHCGKSTEPNEIVPGKPVVRLKTGVHSIDLEALNLAADAPKNVRNETR